MDGVSTITKTVHINIERKIITLERGSNHQGEYLRIYENAMGRKNLIVMPAEGIQMLRDALDEMAGE